MKGFLKFVIVVLILGIIIYCVYQFALPVYAKGWLDYQVTMVVNKDEKAEIEAVQNVVVPNLSVTYQELFEDFTKYPYWEYTVATTSTNRIITFNGQDATFEYTGGANEDVIYNKADLRAVFEIMPDGSIKMDMYLNNELQSQDQKVEILGIMSDKMEP